jgi:hypothetical protein
MLSTTHAVGFIVTAAIVALAFIFAFVDLAARLEFIQEKLPWLQRWLERRSSVVYLLIIAIYLQVLFLAELKRKEVPPCRFSPRISVAFLLRSLKNQIDPVRFHLLGYVSLQCMYCKVNLQFRDRAESIESRDERLPVARVTIPSTSRCSREGLRQARWNPTSAKTGQIRGTRNLLPVEREAFVTGRKRQVCEKSRLAAVHASVTAGRLPDRYQFNRVVCFPCDVPAAEQEFEVVQILAAQFLRYPRR